MCLFWVVAQVALQLAAPVLAARPLHVAFQLA